MKKAEYKEAKRLRRLIKTERYHLRTLQFDFEMGGRRQSHTPAKSVEPSEQADFNRMAAEIKEADKEQITRQMERIAVLEQKFIAIGIPEKSILLPTLFIKIQNVYWRRGDSDNPELFIAFTNESGALRFGDMLALSTSTADVSAIVIDGKPNTDNPTYKLCSLAVSDKTVHDMLASYQAANKPVPVYHNHYYDK